MCQICDDLGQWVCDCGRVVKIGRACRDCRRVRSDSYVDCVTMYLSTAGEPLQMQGRVPNRAARRVKR